ncbi:flagellar hook-length control protein FliK [Aliarcobacter thereius]|uniref:Flagellar hook-length control protein FliK n=2 Tax=Aliarcobacter thereius TaxID=544718 RepID=A0A1C0B940_9BACT|nr:flagellar hook-length control protein FliK [Aliarcobacter thereius]OCL94664.1 Flagellar hook-length control protein FliK [Aliarcobacter thereius LMG 24486]OCM00110.1 Flagellar hook-length control protein FliK [Aliarcobacter thereius]QBF15460.1 flagellar hook-length control protein FliK [Aliarcobacter thereius LMG 24486]TLS93274.1 flagellar hook-length control protein FliK [Aliarcobacter thereius]
METLLDISAQTQDKASKTKTILSSGTEKIFPSLFDSILQSVSNSEVENNIDTKFDSQDIKQDSYKNQSDQTKVELNLDESKQKLDNLDLESNIDLKTEKGNMNLDEESLLKIENEEDTSLKYKKTEINNEKELNKDSTYKNKGNFLDKIIFEIKNNSLKEKSIENNLEIKDSDKIEISSNNSEELIKNIIKTEDNDNKDLKKIINDTIYDSNNIKIENKDNNLENIEISVDKNEFINSLEENSEEIKFDKKINDNSKLDKEVSLMDRLIQKNSNKNENIINKEIVKEEFVQNKTDIFTSKQDESLINNLQKVDSSNEAKKQSLMDSLISQSLNNSEEIEDIEENKVDENSSKLKTSSFLNEQESRVNKQLLFNKNEAMSILENAKSIEDIKHSATILDLDANEINISKEIEKNSLKTLILEKENLDRKSILETFLNERNIRSIDVRNLITNSIEASKALIEGSLNFKDDTTIDFTHNITNHFATKIVAAKQQVNSMMSDIARQMYENYKPPVTAFRMNINPENLGSISVLMKSDRSSGLTISLSVSSLATLELLMENQNILRNSLSKTFNDSSSFNLDFKQGGDSNSQNSHSSKEQNKRAYKSSEDILKIQETNRELEDKNDYM